MKKELLESMPIALPIDIKKFIGGAPIYDNSCNSNARVFFVDKGDGFYLKVAPKGELLREMEMTNYFHKKGMGAEVLAYFSGESDYLLTTKVKGEDCTFEEYLNNPKRLCTVLGERLRLLHEINFDDCPIKDKMEEYFVGAENNYRLGNYDKSHFPDSFGYKSEEEAYKAFIEGKDGLKGKVLLHGDYCLPNVILDKWKFSAFIDVGGAGVGDRHIDLFWGLWSLSFNLKTEKYGGRFLDVYGRDLVDESLLRVVGAIEVFG